jgi:hypothetical protein
MTNSINNYQLKHCEKEEDSKTRVQEESNQKKRFSFLMSTPTNLLFQDLRKLMITV